MLCKNQLREHGSWGISLAFSGSTPLLRDLRKASAETNILGSWDSVENCRWILKPTRTPKSKDFGVEKHGKTTQSLSVCFGEVDRKISDWFLFWSEMEVHNSHVWKFNSPPAHDTVPARRWCRWPPAARELAAAGPSSLGPELRFLPIPSG